MKGAIRVKECPSEELILRLAQDELDESQSRLIVEHAESCGRCAKLIEEYKATFRLLATERIEAPSPGEWERVMGKVRGSVTEEMHAWPLWARGAAAALATACLMLVLWQARVLMTRPPGELSGLAERSEEALPSEETLFASDTMSVNLASLDNGQLDELDELYAGGTVLHGSDALVFDLTEEEEERLIEELESSPST
ncbi:MAG: hypothetical protein JSW03_08030 [Candidatus Eiseniibacteriota bacterium]|nr:MAG: hypothetical protein JSW03_08030 [Candidatus Eisenbacteria bacterium]